MLKIFYLHTTPASKPVVSCRPLAYLHSNSNTIESLATAEEKTQTLCKAFIKQPTVFFYR